MLAVKILFTMLNAVFLYSKDNPGVQNCSNLNWGKLIKGFDFSLLKLSYLSLFYPSVTIF